MRLTDADADAQKFRKASYSHILLSVATGLRLSVEDPRVEFS
jgi:hypothetical protein